MASSSRAVAGVAAAAALSLSVGAATPAAASPALPPSSTVATLAPSAVPTAVSVRALGPTLGPVRAEGPVISPGAGATALPGIATEGWVLADLDTGEILAMQNGDKQMRPASTLKMLTALTVVPRLNPQQPYRAVKADETAEGNRVVLYEGLTYTVEDLVHALLMPSANDAAEALARANGGVAVTVEQMNAEAARIGATSTTARNPSGLDADGQFTSPKDLATIGRAAFANPEIAEYLTLAVVDFPGKQLSNGKRVIYPIYNLNRMLRDGFKGALGGKPGFTTQARRTFVAAAERDGRRLIVSLMNIGGNTYRTAEVLLNWAFANEGKLAAVGRLPEPTAPAPVYERTIVPLSEDGSAPTTNTSVVASGDQSTPGDPVASDAPTAVAAPREWRLPSLPGLPTILQVLTLVAGAIALMRARVYWLTHRHRTGWTPLEPTGPRRPRPERADLGSAPRVSRPSGTSRSESLVGARR